MAGAGIRPEMCALPYLISTLWIEIRTINMAFFKLKKSYGLERLSRITDVYE